jgi:hypothetical protein
MKKEKVKNTTRTKAIRYFYERSKNVPKMRVLIDERKEINIEINKLRRIMENIDNYFIQ